MNGTIPVVSPSAVVRRLSLFDCGHTAAKRTHGRSLSNGSQFVDDVTQYGVMFNAQARLAFGISDFRRQSMNE